MVTQQKILINSNNIKAENKKVDEYFSSNLNYYCQNLVENIFSRKEFRAFKARRDAFILIETIKICLPIIAPFLYNTAIKPSPTDKNNKIYKVIKTNNNNILPGDLKGLPDDCLFYSNKINLEILNNG